MKLTNKLMLKKYIMQCQTYQQYYFKINIFFIFKNQLHLYKTQKNNLNELA